jgi:hypothetical protein
MIGDDVDVSKWKEIGRSDFGREFLSGYTCVEVIAFQNEESGEIRVLVEVPNAQIFALPTDLVPLVQVIGWAIACLASDGMVMVPRDKAEEPLGRFRIWQGCCRILNSLDPWARHLEPDM